MVRRLVLASAVLALMLPAGPADARGSQLARAARKCRSVGPAQSDVGLYRIFAQRISCRRARRILTRWYNDPTQPNSGPRGWSCRTFVTGPFSERTYCFQGRRKISFTRLSA